jgi:hypothetical protein
VQEGQQRCNAARRHAGDVRRRRYRIGPRAVPDMPIRTAHRIGHRIGHITRKKQRDEIRK